MGTTENTRNENLQKYEGRIPRDEVLTSRLTPKRMSEASATLNARALKARSISPCKAMLHPAGECPRNLRVPFRDVR